MLRKLNEYLTDICDEKGITYEEGQDPWLIRLKKDGIVRYVVESDLGLNNSVVNKLCVDKSRCYEVLKWENVDAVPHYFYGNTYGVKNFTDSSQLKNLLIKIDSLGYPVVVKDNLGGSGELVYLVKSGREFDHALSDLLVRGRDIAVSPFKSYEKEYRVTVLDGEVMFSYVKVKGESSWQHNLSKGSFVSSVGEKEKEGIHQLALEASEALGLRFGNVDVIDVDGRLMVLEVNSSVTFSILSELTEEYGNVAGDIYRKALDKLFDPTFN